MDVVVRSAELVAPRVKSFELADPAGALLPEFTAGSHVDVSLPNGLVRSYSLLNDSRERNRYVIGVLREEAGGGGSAWVHDSLQAGRRPEHHPNRRTVSRSTKAATTTFLLPAASGSRRSYRWPERFDELGIDFKLYFCTRKP